MSAQDKTKSFLEIASEFQLGHLATEGFHPDTASLSSLVKTNLPEALRLLQQVDKKALDKMIDKATVVYELATTIQKTLSQGNKVFMCGCGATGRLSLVLETLYRQKFSNDQVISFMAGGDFALIKSVESFEDRTDFGARQLMELGFGPYDLLLASSEGGETPFVIGAVNKASEVSSRSPYFLYCNPDELLMPIERSREVITNKKIKKVNLTVGPMAISGSTRMQASTVLMLAIGVGLLHQHKDETEFNSFYQDYLFRLKNGADYGLMAPLTKLEATLYQDKKYLNYLAGPILAISILTDTTERSPTFSLRGFENRLDQVNEHSLSYLFIDEAQSSAHAWSELLRRTPRALQWTELNGRIDLERVYGFDISGHGIKQRSSMIPVESFRISYVQGKIEFNCRNHKLEFQWGNDNLFDHLMLKMLLNAHSTSIMGILGRYEGNVMTWVRPSNNKLIDRAARYVLQLLKNRNKIASYEEVVEKIFEETEFLKENEPVVLKVVEKF